MNFRYNCCYYLHQTVDDVAVLLFFNAANVKQVLKTVGDDLILFFDIVAGAVWFSAYYYVSCCS